MFSAMIFNDLFLEAGHSIAIGAQTIVSWILHANVCEGMLSVLNSFNQTEYAVLVLFLVRSEPFLTI